LHGSATPIGAIARQRQLGFRGFPAGAAGTVPVLEMALGPGAPPNRRGVLWRYALATAGLSIVWETLQLPLYTIWREGPISRIAFAVLHCTAGDLLIAGTALACALFLVGRGWPVRSYVRTALLAIAAGLVYTAFSEWRNAVVLGDLVLFRTDAPHSRPVHRPFADASVADHSGGGLRMVLPRLLDPSSALSPLRATASEGDPAQP
jgi:hypothetical protein